MSSMHPSFGGAAVRPCMRCGAPLSPNEGQCSRCGMFNPPPQGQQSGMFQQGQQGRNTGASWGMQVPQSPPQNGGWGDSTGSSTAWGQQSGGWQQNQNALFPNQNRVPSQPLQNNLFGGNNGGGFGNPNQSSLNNAFANFQNNPQNNFFGAQQGFGSASPVGTASRPLRPGSGLESREGKKRSNAVAAVLVIVILIAALGGGGYFAYKTFKNSNSPTVNATPAVVTTPTGTPLFSDFFKDNKANWNTNVPNNTKVTIGNGQMTLEADTHGVLLPEILPGGKTYADFRIDVDAALAKGDNANGYGIYIRAASTPDSPLGLYYRFEVYGDGSFAIYIGKPNPANGNTSSTSLKSSNPNNAVHTDGRLNHLTVIAQGSQLSFLINGTNVSTFSDTTYKSGAVALFVSNLNLVGAGTPAPANQPANAQATFKNLAIFPAQ